MVSIRWSVCSYSDTIICTFCWICFYWGSRAFDCPWCWPDGLCCFFSCPARLCGGCGARGSFLAGEQATCYHVWKGLPVELEQDCAYPLLSLSYSCLLWCLIEGSPCVPSLMLTFLLECSWMLIGVWTQPWMHTNSWAMSWMNVSLCIKAEVDIFPGTKLRVYTIRTYDLWSVERLLVETSLWRVTIICLCLASGHLV